MDDKPDYALKDDTLWRAYQEAQGSADHTDRECFNEVVGLEIYRLQSKLDELEAYSICDCCECLTLDPVYAGGHIQCQSCTKLANFKEKRSLARALRMLSEDRYRGERDEALSRLDSIRSVVDAQANDSGLWFDAATAPEAYLQQELRKLHAAIEGVSQEERPLEAISRDERRCKKCGFETGHHVACKAITDYPHNEPSETDSDGPFTNEEPK